MISPWLAHDHEQWQALLFATLKLRILLRDASSELLCSNGAQNKHASSELLCSNGAQNKHASSELLCSNGAQNKHVNIKTTFLKVNTINKQ